MSGTAPRTGPVVIGDTGTRVVVDPDQGLVLWVGPVEADLDAAEVAALVGGYTPPARHQDAPARAVPILPDSAAGWPGRPALTGHRPDGTGWLADFTTVSVEAGADRLIIRARDEVSGLAVRTEFEAVTGGPIRIRHTLTNEADTPYHIDALDVLIPVPDRCAEQLDLTGRWSRERMVQRRPIADGLWLREGRAGKPGPDAPTVLSALTAGAGFGHGEVWSVHPAWSGNCRYLLERLPDGRVVLGAGEALLSGELILAPGQSYSTPWVHVMAGAAGLDSVARQAHAAQRALPHFPHRQPVTLNVWEAVYFDHDLDRLTELAARGAEVGVERFVLDDGWFGARRDDTRGLGDWTVAPAVWPDGLDPLIDVVRGHGLEFGLWFEPEMINADSELFRAHPDWVLVDPQRTPLVFRNQLVLDLGRDEVRQYLFDAIDAVLSRYAIGYVKWDHNRDLYDGAGAGGRPGIHAQTLGFYDLLDRLRTAHPSVAWESCASGGARIDLGVLERCERVWTSDCTDALSRQDIQRWSTQLVAPAYLGAHVSAPENHQTGRRYSLDFRAGTAFFGAFGIEWDLTAAPEADRARLGEWIAAHRRLQPLLHGGDVVRVDLPDDQIRIHGVVAADRSEAVFAYVQLDERVGAPLAFRLTGLDPQRRYAVQRVVADDGPWAGDGQQASGAALAAVGLPAPDRRPQSVAVVHLQAR